MSRARCFFDYTEDNDDLNRPAFWPAAVKDAPLDVGMPTHSDHPGLRSLKDEANRCWDMALQQMQDRGEWLRLMGAAPCMAQTLMLPFRELSFALRYEGKTETLVDMLSELTHPSQFPETRLFGYKLSENTPYTPKTPMPGWVSQLI
jgi:hypothetical protein